MNRRERPSHADCARDDASSSQNGYAVLALLWLIYVTHGINRTVFFVLLEPLSRDLHLSNSDIGLVAGLAYALPFAIAGIPIGALADRFTRKRLLAVLLTLWSATTMLSSLVTGLASLLAARAVIGAAEGGAPSTMLSMLSDSSPQHRRPAMIAAFMTGPHAGLMAGSLIAGGIAAHHGWRAALVVAGLPGLVLALLLLLLLREPQRGRFDGSGSPAAAAASIPQTLRFLLSSRDRAHIFIGVVVAGFVLVALSAFIPTFLVRNHGFSIAAAGRLVAVALGLCAGLGALAGGLMVSRMGWLTRRQTLLLCAAAATAAVPLGLVALLVRSEALVLAALSAWSFASTMYLGPCYSVLITLLPPGMRGTAMGAVAVLTQLLSSLGPAFVGRLSDALLALHDAQALRDALVIAVLVGLLPAFFFWRAARSAAPPPHAAG